MHDNNIGCLRVVSRSQVSSWISIGELCDVLARLPRTRLLEEMVDDVLVEAWLSGTTVSLDVGIENATALSGVTSSERCVVSCVVLHVDEDRCESISLTYFLVRIATSLA